MQFGSVSTAAFYVFTHFFFIFYFCFSHTFLTKLAVNSIFMHCSRVSQIILFNKFFIKNWSHDTIHTFQNYFATVFSVFSFSKISSIQTDHLVIFGYEKRKKLSQSLTSFSRPTIRSIKERNKKKKKKSNSHLLSFQPIVRSTLPLTHHQTHTAAESRRRWSMPPNVPCRELLTYCL